MFSSGVEILDLYGNPIASGKFPLLGSKWKLYNNEGQEIGAIKEKFTFFSKKYEYNAYGRDYFHVKAEAFSKHYEIYKEETDKVATFQLISGFFSSPAYQLHRFSEQLTAAELITVVMGINAFQQRRRNSSAAIST